MVLIDINTLMLIIKIFRLAHLVWEPSILVAMSVVCLSVCCLSSVLHQISETMRDTREISSPYKKSGSESKNMTSDFASEVVAKYPQNPENPQIAHNGDLYN